MKYSKLPRIYENTKLSGSEIIVISPENHNYLKNVMRLKNGFNLRVFNEREGEYFAIYINEKNYSKVKISEKYREIKEKKISINLLVANIKSDKFEMVCDYSTQLGVSSITPIITSRTQKKEINIDRAQKIILEAVRQSERLDFPVLSQITNLEDIDFSLYDNSYFANENETNPKSIELLGQNISVLIGPEGGFTDEEIEYLISQGLSSISIGENVLRSELASAVMITKLLLC
jgi:16S rRNA (uracil1498-N3)-methyltransferase